MFFILRNFHLCMEMETVINCTSTTRTDKSQYSIKQKGGAPMLTMAVPNLVQFEFLSQIFVLYHIRI